MNLRYSLYGIDSSIRIELFVYIFRKKFSDLKNVSSISSGLFPKFEKNCPDFQSYKRENVPSNEKAS